MISIISLVTSISALVFLSSGLYIYFVWRRKKEDDFLLKTFIIFFLGMGNQMVFLTLGLVLFHDISQVSSTFWWIAHVFLFVSSSSLLLLVVKIKAPAKEKIAKKVTIIYPIFAAGVLLFFLPQVEIYRAAENIINWRVPVVSIITISIYVGSIGLYASFVFITEAFRSKEPLTKIRSLLLGTGILLFFIGGPHHNVADNFFLAIIAAVFSVLGGILMVSGVYLKRILKKSNN